MSIDEITATAPDLEPSEADRPRPQRLSWRSRLTRWDMRYSPYLFVSPFFILFAIFGLFPLGYTFWVSLHDWSLLGPHTWIGFDNYTTLFHDEDFWNATRNTFGIFVLATVPQIFFALVLAHTLNKRLRTPTLWRMGVLLPNITSVAAVGIIFTLLFARDFGLVNWALGHVGVEPDHLAGESLVVLAGDLDDGRLALDRLQRADLPRRAAGGARSAVRSGGARRRIQLAAVLVASPCRCSSRR